MKIAFQLSNVIFVLVIALSTLMESVRCSGQEQFDSTPLSISRIPPGTVVNKESPESWSHLIIKSFPCADRGDHKSISNTDRKLSTLFKTVTLANVEKRNVFGKEVFHLTNIAVGVAVPIGSKGDTIVSPKTQKKEGAKLGWLAGIVLSRVYTELEKIKYVGRSDTAAIYDTPLILHFQSKNQEMKVRYAVIVNETTGSLSTLLWLLERDSKGEFCKVAGKVQYLPENFLTNCHLYVDASKYTLGIPSNTAFACESIPKGKAEFEFPNDLKEICGKPTLTNDESEKIVSSLRMIATHFDRKLSK